MSADAVRIAGYASVFNAVDRGRDVVRRGAFARSVATGGRLPVLWQHDPARPVGTVEHVAEDRHGLRVVARLSGGSAAAREARALVAAGAVTGLSFGYRVRGAGPGADAGIGRELTDLDLLEVSLVNVPMQPRARLIGIEPANG